MLGISKDNNAITGGTANHNIDDLTVKPPTHPATIIGWPISLSATLPLKTQFSTPIFTVQS